LKIPNTKRAGGVAQGELSSSPGTERKKKSNDILHKDRKNNREIHMETQKTLISRSNSEQKVQCWRHHNT
jgi:hypothetical protein